MKYRAEVDGLRALAVIPVVLFHAGFEHFNGGFVGVDVFFVISGYLITTIIYSELDDGRFSLLNFYERRARRILPALLLVLIVTYLFSWMFNMPGPHKVIGQYVVSSILFSSNILLYLKGTDYFGLGMGSNPLFHTWSLGVEEQYYILFPLFMMAAVVWFRRYMISVLIIVSICSLILAHWSAYNSPSAAFFLLPTRGWEILLGAFCAFYLRGRGQRVTVTHQYLSMLGVVLISTAVVTFDSSTPTPSVYTLVPTLGAVLIILYATNGTVVNKVLSTSPFVGVGLISYSTYLWHQPVLTYGDLYFGHEKPLMIVVALIMFIILCSYLSWRFVESWFRSPKKMGIVRFSSSIGASVCILLSLGVIGHLNNGYPERNEVFSKLAHNTGFGLHCNGNLMINDACASSESPRIAALGNSYMMQFVAPLDKIYGARGVLQLTQDSCKVGFSDDYYDINNMPCPDFYQGALETIMENEIDIVFISSPFKEVLEPIHNASLAELLQKLSEKRVIIIGPTPRAPFDVGTCLSRKHGGLSLDVVKSCDFTPEDTHVTKLDALRDMTGHMGHVELIDVTPVICPNGECNMEPEDGLLMYVDTGHLTRDGSLYVLHSLKDKLPDL